MSRRRCRPEEIRIKIVKVADGLFRQYGFDKTTVADIANALGMSSAYIYKFFPSRNALLEACADNNLGILKETVVSIVSGKGPVFVRMEEAVLAVFRHHRDLLRNEKQIFKLVLTARQGNWKCIRAFDLFIAEVLRELVTQGRQRGEFVCEDTEEVVGALRDSLWIALCPHMRHDYQPDESEDRVTRQIQFLGRALGVGE